MVLPAVAMVAVAHAPFVCVHAVDICPGSVRTAKTPNAASVFKDKPRSATAVATSNGSSSIVWGHLNINTNTHPFDAAVHTQHKPCVRVSVVYIKTYCGNENNSE